MGPFCESKRAVQLKCRNLGKEEAAVRAREERRSRVAIPGTGGDWRTGYHQVLIVGCTTEYYLVSQGSGVRVY